MPSNFEQDPLEARRAEIERLYGAQAQYFKVYGDIEVSGIGEVTADIIFPIRFVDRPIPHYGSSLSLGTSATSGSYPAISVSVLIWDTAVKPDGGHVYVGANLGIVVNGESAQTMIVHYSFEGVGLNNPAEV